MGAGVGAASVAILAPLVLLRPANGWSSLLLGLLLSERFAVPLRLLGVQRLLVLGLLLLPALLNVLLPQLLLMLRLLLLLLLLLLLMRLLLLLLLLLLLRVLLDLLLLLRLLGFLLHNRGDDRAGEVVLQVVAQGRMRGGDQRLGGRDFHAVIFDAFNH